jgi:hypothetical protein
MTQKIFILYGTPAVRAEESPLLPSAKADAVELLSHGMAFGLQLKLLMPAEGSPLDVIASSGQGGLKPLRIQRATSDEPSAGARWA